MAQQYGPHPSYGAFSGNRSQRFGGGIYSFATASFKLGAGGSIDPTTEPVNFKVGSFSVRLPAGSYAARSLVHQQKCGNSVSNW